MNITEKKLRGFINLYKENKLNEYMYAFGIKDLKEAQRLFTKVILLRPKSTEALKSLCRGSKEKRIKDILKKEYLTEYERVDLAIWVVANNKI